MPETCRHLAKVADVALSTDGCGNCLRTGGSLLFDGEGAPRAPSRP